MDSVGPNQQLHYRNQHRHLESRFYGTPDHDLNDLLCRFWAQEEVPSAKAAQLNADEEQCEQHFLITNTRSPFGRYVMRLPFRLQPAAFGSSYFKALRMLHKLQRRLGSDTAFLHLYTDFLKEYEEIFEISDTCLTFPSLTLFQLPCTFYLTTAFSRKAVQQLSSTLSSTAHAQQRSTCLSIIAYTLVQSNNGTFSTFYYIGAYTSMSSALTSLRCIDRLPYIPTIVFSRFFEVSLHHQLNTVHTVHTALPALLTLLSECFVSSHTTRALAIRSPLISY